MIKIRMIHVQEVHYEEGPQVLSALSFADLLRFGWRTRIVLWRRAGAAPIVGRNRGQRIVSLWRHHYGPWRGCRTVRVAAADYTKATDS